MSKPSAAKLTSSWKPLVHGVCLAAALALAAPAQASVVFTGSGYNPETKDNNQSAQATFSLATDAQTKIETLTLTLTNTTGTTVAQGDALTGILFSLKNGSTLSLASLTTSLGTSALYGSSGDGKKTKWTTDISQTVTGAWTDALANPESGQYGIATTGFGNLFSAGNISLGNKGAPDYGIVGATTFSSGTPTFGQSPFADNSLTFTLKVASGSLAESNIGNVQFLFGTNGSGIISATSTGSGSGGGKVPEPASLVLVGIGLVALRANRKRS